MLTVTKKHTISQIIANRKDKRTKTKMRFNTIDIQKAINLESSTNNGQSKTDYLLKKINYHNQDKLLLLKHIQRTYRIHFDHNMNVTLLNLINVKEQTIINKYYDSNQKSYFMLKGKMTIFQKGYSLRQTYQSDHSQTNKGNRYVQIECFQGQKGIGKVFNDDQYSKVMIKCQNAVVLEIIHNNNEHLGVQRNCYMTFEQKQQFVMGLNLFKNLDNVNRYYIPFFKSRKVNKGDLIYTIGQRSQYMYLIVDGQVQFQSKINIQQLQTSNSTAITELILKNQYENYILITTQLLSNSNYFGQEQILINSTRKQNAKCLSLTCLLLEISLEKVNKLLFYNEFREVIQSTAREKQNQRQKKINNVINFRKHKKQSNLNSQRKNQENNNMTFEELDKEICRNCSNLTKQDIKISLNHKKTKIVHGNNLKVPDVIHHHSKLKTQNFSMLEVNRSVFESSLKKYRFFSVYQKKYQTSKNKDIKKKQKQGRTLFKMWKVLNLHNILQEQQRYNIQQQDGMQYYNTYMRRAKHLSDIKSYRPKTVSSNCRVKIQYINYLHKIQ